MGVQVTRRLEWDSAHRVMRHESKCATLHGHRYVALVTVVADSLDSIDRVVDFGVIKQKVGGWIDERWDHTTLVNKDDADLIKFCLDQQDRLGHKAPYLFYGEPTAEVIADVLRKVAAQTLTDERISVLKVEVFETPNCSAVAQ